MARRDATPRCWSALVDVYQPVLRDVVADLERDAGIDSGTYSALAYLDRAVGPDAARRAARADAGALQPTRPQSARATHGGRRPAGPDGRPRRPSGHGGAPDPHRPVPLPRRARRVRDRARRAPRLVRRRRGATLTAVLASTPLERLARVVDQRATSDAGFVATIVRISSGRDPFDGQRVGEPLQPLGRRIVHRLAVVARQRAARRADPCARHRARSATGRVASAPMHVSAHSSIVAPSSASSAHSSTLEVRAGELLHRVRHEHLLARSRTPGRPRWCSAAVVWPVASTASWSRHRSAISRTSGSSAPSSSSTARPGPGMPSCAATPLATSWRDDNVGNHTIAAAERERDLDRDRVEPADLVVAAHPAEHVDPVDGLGDDPGELRGRLAVRLQQHPGVAGVARLRGRLDRGDRPLAGARRARSGSADRSPRRCRRSRPSP